MKIMSCSDCSKQAKDTCPCTYPCERHGKCDECIAYHRGRNELPACYFTTEEEKTYDRSMEFYTKHHD